MSTSFSSPANCFSSSREINEEPLSPEQSNSSTPITKRLGDQVTGSIYSIDLFKSVDTIVFRNHRGG